MFYLLRTWLERFGSCSPISMKCLVFPMLLDVSYAFSWLLMQLACRNRIWLHRGSDGCYICNNAFRQLVEV